MQAQPIERKYALTKIGRGDYLLPSNDATTIWRIAQYEDGPSQGLDIPRDRMFWGAWRWRGRISAGGALLGFDPSDWDQWELACTACKTRAQAISAALR